MKFTEENVQKQVVLNKRKSTEKITKTGGLSHARPTDSGFDCF